MLSAMHAGVEGEFAGGFTSRLSCRLWSQSIGPVAPGVRVDVKILRPGDSKKGNGEKEKKNKGKDIETTNAHRGAPRSRMSQFRHKEEFKYQIMPRGILSQGVPLSRKGSKVPEGTLHPSRKRGEHPSIQLRDRSTRSAT